MNKVSLLVRKLTVPPIFAALLLIVTYAARPDYYGNVWSLLLGICFFGGFTVTCISVAKIYSAL